MKFPWQKEKEAEQLPQMSYQEMIEQERLQRANEVLSNSYNVGITKNNGAIFTNTTANNTAKTDRSNSNLFGEIDSIGNEAKSQGYATNFLTGTTEKDNHNVVWKDVLGESFLSGLG